MRALLNGNSAASMGVALSRVEVIAAYPITPQTSVVEELSAMCATGKLRARFIMVESEHSALACVLGAATAGARTFTATSSQGLLYMHEILHWASGARVPLVLVNVNRSIAPPWNVWADQTDSLSQRDTGWIQVYCGNAQEILDTIPIAYRVAERLHVPVMVCYEGFYISHTQEVVELFDEATADSFLGEKKYEGYIDFDNPSGIDPLTFPEDYARFRKQIHHCVLQGNEIFKEEFERFATFTGRHYSSLDLYTSGKGKSLLVTSGALRGNALVAQEILKKRGFEIALANVRVLKPFPSADFARIAAPFEEIIIMERDISPGSGGIIYGEIASRASSSLENKKLFNVIAGLGGMDVKPEDVVRMVEKLLVKERKECGTYFLEDL